MPILVAWIGEMLLSTIGQLAISALVSLGIGFATSSAAGSFIGMDAIRSTLGQAGPIVDYLGWLGVDRAITIVLSAWAGRAVTSAARVHFVSKRAAA